MIGGVISNGMMDKYEDVREPPPSRIRYPFCSHIAPVGDFMLKVGGLNLWLERAPELATPALPFGPDL